MLPGEGFAGTEQHRHFGCGGTCAGIAAKAQEFDGEGESIPIERPQEIRGKDKSSHKDWNREVGRIVELRDGSGQFRDPRANLGFGNENCGPVPAGQS